MICAHFKEKGLDIKWGEAAQPLLFFDCGLYQILATAFYYPRASKYFMGLTFEQQTLFKGGTKIQTCMNKSNIFGHLIALIVIFFFFCDMICGILKFKLIN